MVDTVANPLSMAGPAVMEPSTQPCSGPSVPFIYKSRLQEYAQRSSQSFPVYQTVNVGTPHAPRFRSTVLVDRDTYMSPNTFQQRKAAEHDAARVALESIQTKIKREGLSFIREGTFFCKSILNEYAVKMNLDKPVHNTVQSQGFVPAFVSSLVFDGVTYTGNAGRSKKEAEQLAAQAVLLAIMDNSGSGGTLLSEIIKSKSKLYVCNINGSCHVDDGIVAVTENQGNSSVTCLDKGKEIEAAVETDLMTIKRRSERPTDIAVAQTPLHLFKKPRDEMVLQSIPPPILFVPSASEQHCDFGSSSSEMKQSRRKKKKKNKNKPNGAQ